MDINTVEREIADSIRRILNSKGVDGSHIKMKAKTKTTSAKIPVKPQGAKEIKEIVEWPMAAATMVKMKFSVEFAFPESDPPLP